MSLLTPRTAVFLHLSYNLLVVRPTENWSRKMSKSNKIRIEKLQKQ